MPKKFAELAKVESDCNSAATGRARFLTTISESVNSASPGNIEMIPICAIYDKQTAFICYGVINFVPFCPDLRLGLEN